MDYDKKWQLLKAVVADSNVALRFEAKFEQGDLKAVTGFMNDLLRDQSEMSGLMWLRMILGGGGELSATVRSEQVLHMAASLHLAEPKNAFFEVEPVPKSGVTVNKLLKQFDLAECPDVTPKRVRALICDCPRPATDELLSEALGEG